MDNRSKIKERGRQKGISKFLKGLTHSAMSMSYICVVSDRGVCHSVSDICVISDTNRCLLSMSDICIISETNRCLLSISDICVVSDRGCATVPLARCQWRESGFSRTANTRLTLEEV